MVPPFARLRDPGDRAQSAGPATTLGTIWKHHEYLEFVPYLE
ncbi:MAG TPA: hypothetical protein VFN91_11015 [Myxococcaceae bacterium]|nr:hypothetical protein [Myxococcaceae bacterium]